MSDAPSSPARAAGSSRDEAEIAKFAALADAWWDAEGDFAPLHAMNPARLDFVVEQVTAQFGRDPAALRALDGLDVLDIGCGGGLLCEPLARLGASVTGIDAAAEGIDAARLHAEAGGLSIDYRAITAEELAVEGRSFDVVCALEIVEHLADVDAFLKAAVSLVRPGGLIFVSTLNRTPQSFALAIIGAEYILRWLPRGTHDWKRFLTPEEVRDKLRNAGSSPVDATGFSYAPFQDSWRRNPRDLSVNYAIVAERPR